MGLDISYHNKLKLVPDAALDEDGCPVTADQISVSQETIDCTEENWPGHTRGIEAGVYSYNEYDSFCAGSYGGYNMWRDQLAQLAYGRPAKWVWENVKLGPFFELVHFADNEGIIGPQVCEKLAKDFADWDARAKLFNPGDGWFYRMYQIWAKAFRVASDGGIVVFH